jgi:regulator of RNase E activity RraA
VSHEQYPPTTAIADVLALRGLPGVLDRSRVAPVGTPTPRPVAGRARTVRLEPGTGGFGPLYSLLSSSLRGHVVVIDAAGVDGAVWGEILTAAARQAGAAAVVVDGRVRDHAAMVASGLPVWGGAPWPTGPAGRACVTAIDQPVHVAGANVRPGDLLVVDDDGVVALRDPALMDGARAILAKAARYAAAEQQVLEAMAGGDPLQVAYQHKAAVVRQIAGSEPT